MKSSLLSKLALALFLMVLTLGSHAQWTPQTDINTMVSNARTGDIQSVGTSDGKTWVVYWKEMPAPQNYEMRCQLLDANGIQLFGPDGMLVNNVVPMSTYTTLWSIAIGPEDNLFIGMNGSDVGNTAYVHKISTAGTQLWGSTGVVIGAGYDVRLLPLSNGGLVVHWSPGNQGMLQKYDATGQAVWPSAVMINPLVSGHKTSAGEMAELSNGDFVVLVHDRGGFSPSSTFHAMRYTGAGTLAWAAPVPIANASTVFNRRYTLVHDQDTLYLGYTSSIGTDFQSYLQRINPDGTLPWGINGSDFAIQSNYFEMDTKAAFSGGSAYVWAICQFTDFGQSLTGEYVQKFDKQSGARQFSINGKMVFPVDANMQSHKGDLQLVTDNPFFVTSYGLNNGASPIDFVATLLDGNGDFAWPDTSRAVATSLETKFRVNFTTPVQGQSVCVWVEDRDIIGESRAFAQNVMADFCPPPLANFSYTISGLTVNFTSTAINVDTINWVFSDGGIANGNVVSHTFPSTGVFVICQEVGSDCGSDQYCDTITIVSIGIEQPDHAASFSIYPNPSHGQLSIDFKRTDAVVFSCRIMSMTSQLLYEYPASTVDGSSVLRFPSLNLKPGIYLISYVIDGKQGVQRFSVTK